APVVRGAGGMVHDLVALGEQGGKCVGVPRGNRDLEAGGVRARGVRAYSAFRSRGSCACESRRRWLGGQLVEARERLDLALGVELLPARQEAVGSEDPEHEEVPLEGAAADA